MTSLNGAPDSDSVNLGSNPSSPATDKHSVSADNSRLPEPATYATHANGQRTSAAQESAQSIERRRKFWGGMCCLVETLHDAGMPPDDMRDLIDWFAAWARDPYTPRPTPKSKRR